MNFKLSYLILLSIFYSFNVYCTVHYAQSQSVLRGLLTENTISDGDTIRITSDFSISTGNSFSFGINRTYTIDLFGHTLSGQTVDNFIEITNGHITICDSSTDLCGKIINSATNSGKAIKLKENNNVSLAINGGTIQGYRGIYQGIGSTLTINQGHIIGTGDTALATEAKTNIYGGYLSGSSDAIIYNNKATLYILGGYFSHAVTPATGYYCHDNYNETTNATYKQQVSSDHITVYHWDSENNQSSSLETTLSNFDWASTQYTYKNSIAVVEEDNNDWASTQKNVLVEHIATDDAKTYTCPDFVLTDKEDFFTPYNFTASKATYTRDAVYAYNSFCLPFAITESDINGSIYNFSNYDNVNNTVMLTTQNSIAEGMPCIIKCNDTSSGLMIEKSNVAISNTINNSGYIKGRFVLDNNIGGGKYKLNSDGTAFGITSDGATCYPFRSYIDVGNSSDAKTSIGIIWGGNQTDISSIESKASRDMPSIRYSLSGIETKYENNGLYIIWTKDGRALKCIIK